MSLTKICQPQDHTIYFSGDIPCNVDGTPMTAIINNSQTQHLSQRIVVNHYFSSRPITGNYTNYYEKIRTYAEILGSQVREIDRTASAKPKKISQNDKE